MIEVEHFYGLHQGGTKDYHLYLFTKRGERSGLLIKRWGKAGTDGQVKVELGGKVQLDKELKERSSRGYSMTRENGSSGSFPDAIHAMSMLPRAHQRAVSNAQLSIIDPNRFSAGDSSAYDPLSGARAASIQQVQQTKDQQDDADSMAALQSHPHFGMF